MANLRSRRIAALECKANAPELIIPEIVILDDGRVMQNHAGLILPLPMSEAAWCEAASKHQAELTGGA